MPSRTTQLSLVQIGARGEGFNNHTITDMRVFIDNCPLNLAATADADGRAHC